MSDESKPESGNQHSKILYIFTRTPLHVGAGASVGAIDQPVQRERHTGFPIIPASSLKGAFVDNWIEGLIEESNEKNEIKKVRVGKNGKTSAAAWLFGSDSDTYAAAGALQFSEARVLAFPIRSAKGSFAWITCPLMLQRAARDRAVDLQLLNKIQEPKDDEAIFDAGPDSRISIDSRIVLEDYTFKLKNWIGLSKISEGLTLLFPDDPIWKEINDRLVILSNGMMSFFARNACEIAQHVRISDETGTAEGGALFNQENVPSETMFYSVLKAFDERSADRTKKDHRKAEDALKEFSKKINGKVIQFGGNASTGLGYSTINLQLEKGN